jgi:hypothetical protein
VLYPAESLLSRELIKIADKSFDILIKDIKTDTKITKLLQILGTQLELLVNKGSPDFLAFLGALKEGQLLSEEELHNLQKNFSLDGVSDYTSRRVRQLIQPISTQDAGALDAAVDQLIEALKTKVFGKEEFEDSDSITVNDSVEIGWDIFHRFRHGKWLDGWAILVAMTISDKPSYVRYRYSVPLHEIDKDNCTRRRQRPLAGWANEIIEFRSQTKEKLVYFCPLNHKNSHFTLLEINDHEKVIRHYDSKADLATIRDPSKQTTVSRLVQVRYHEGQRQTFLM